MESGLYVDGRIWRVRIKWKYYFLQVKQKLWWSWKRFDKDSFIFPELFEKRMEIVNQYNEFIKMLQKMS